MFNMGPCRKLLFVVMPVVIVGWLVIVFEVGVAGCDVAVACGDTAGVTISVASCWS